MFGLKKRRPKGDMITVFQSLKAATGKKGWISHNSPKSDKNGEQEIQTQNEEEFSKLYRVVGPPASWGHGRLHHWRLPAVGMGTAFKELDVALLLAYPSLCNPGGRRGV